MMRSRCGIHRETTESTEKAVADATGFLIGLLFVALIAVVILSLIAISLGWRTTVNERTGEFVLRYSPPLRVFAVAGGFGFPVAVMLMVLLKPPQRPEDILATEIGLLLFKLLGWVLLQETYMFRVVVSEEELVSYSPWRRTRVIRWDEVAEVESVCPKSWFVFTAWDRQQIHVPLGVEGLSLLVNAMRRHLPPERYARAVPGFRMAAKGSEVNT
jgi:hypothetical protein